MTRLLFWMSCAAWIAVSPAAATTQASPTGEADLGAVVGTVRGHLARPGAPLPYAVVQVRSAGLMRSALADSLGHYRVAGLPPGLVSLTASHPGHRGAALDVLVAAGATVVLDLDLERSPVRLAALDVRGSAHAPEPGERLGEGTDLARIEVAALEGGIGVADPAMAAAVGALPGNDPADPSDVLFMRGSTADLKLVLLDGAPVFTPFHMAGLLRTFEPDVLGRAALHVGGAPARYDGGLSSILDLRTRRPRGDRLRGSGGVDLLSAGVSAEGPLPAGATFMVSARALHNGGTGPLGDGGTPYGYRDLLTSVEAEPAPGHLARATGFWNRESVDLDLPSVLGPAADLGLPRDAWWSNRALSALYRADVGASTTVEVTGAVSGYEAALPLQPTAPDGSDVEPLLAGGSNDRIRIVGEVSRTTASARVRAGFTVDRADLYYFARPLVGRPDQGVHTSAQGSVVGGYVDATRRVVPEMTLRVGARVDRLSGNAGGVKIAPRVSATWTVGPNALLTVAAGRYHQHARSLDVEVERTISETAYDGLQRASLLPVATSDHVVVSLDQSLGKATRLGLEGFWKRFQGLRPESGETVRSSGMDLRVQRRGDRVTAWLGYGLSWFWSQADLSGPTSEFTGRHLLSAGFGGSLTRVLGAELRLAYGAGLPYTAIPFGGVTDVLGAQEDEPPSLEGDPPGRREALLPTGLDEEFLRVDLELHADFESRWGDRTVHIRPYLRVLNALDRRDALFYTFQPWRQESPRPLAERTLLPVLGLSWRF